VVVAGRRAATARFEVHVYAIALPTRKRGAAITPPYPVAFLQWRLIFVGGAAADTHGLGRHFREVSTPKGLLCNHVGNAVAVLIHPSTVLLYRSKLHLNKIRAAQ
jgi:hypothetical protein